MDLYVPVIVYVVMVSSFTFSYASSILWLSDRLQAKIAVWLQYILYKFPFIYNALVAMNKLFYILDNLINWCRNVMFFWVFLLSIACVYFLQYTSAFVRNHYIVLLSNDNFINHINYLISIVNGESNNHNSLSQTLEIIQGVRTKHCNHWIHQSCQ